MPSPGARRRPHERGEERIHFVGKIAAIVYDRFGDFEGFTLDTEDGARSFHPSNARSNHNMWPFAKPKPTPPGEVIRNVLGKEVDRVEGFWRLTNADLR